MSAEAKLAALGLVLPGELKPVDNYVSAVQTGNLLFMAGCGPQRPDGSLITGKIGLTMTTDEGYQAARAAGISMLGNVRSAIGSLDRVTRIVKVLGMVNATPDFADTPKVINGFSDLMVEVFGAAGRGARSAVGVATLPFQMAVEVEMVLEIKA